MLFMEFGYNQPSSFRGEVVCKCGWMTDDRRTCGGACLYFKLPRSLRFRSAKNLQRKVKGQKNKKQQEDEMGKH